MKIVPTGGGTIDFHRSETDPLHYHHHDGEDHDPAEHSSKDADASMTGGGAESASSSPPRTKRKQKTASTLATAMSSTGDGDDAVILEADHHHHHILWRRRGDGNGWGRGIAADVRRTLAKNWRRDMTNLNCKTLAVSFFLFFACIAPAITFGAIYAKATNNNIGAVEMITATAWCGIVYSLIGGQPIMINGGTGPVLAFAEILYKLSQSLDVPFLVLNAWVGIWVCIYMVIAAVADLNRIIAYATRFTDEIFSFLIAVIFIINALGSPFSTTGVYHYFDFSHKSHDAYEDDPYYSHWASALLSLGVCIGTVQLAFLLRKIKFSPFLPNQTLRNATTDFAVVTSIIIWSLIGNLVFSSIPLETLTVPPSFAPTFQCCDETCETNWPNDCYEQDEPWGTRSWLVDLGNVKGKAWIPIMAAGPGLLAFILVFLDDGITWHLANHPQHKLKNGSAYNWDTIVIGIFVFINSLLGLPWLVAATVRTLNHIHALAEKTPEGKILSVQETRLTSFFIHLLCLASIFALNVLKLIPVPVLYGVFLFMGLVSLGTNQFWGRMMLFFMQPSRYPVTPFTKYMKPKRIHLFTGIQLLLFALLYVVKSIKTIAIAFPLMIAACIPIRMFLLPKIFSEEELILLDTDEGTVKEWLQAHEHGGEDGSGSDKFADNKHDDIEMQRASAEPQKEGEKMQSAVTPTVDAFVAQQPQQTPPPTRRTRPSRDKRRSTSCPAPHMLFVDGTSAPVAPELPVIQPSIWEISAQPVPRVLFEIPEEHEHEHEHEAETPPQSEVDSSVVGGRHGTQKQEGSFVNEAGEGEAATKDDTTTTKPRRRRPKRKKTVSCPTHMLFHEGNKHVSHNYYFG